MSSTVTTTPPQTRFVALSRRSGGISRHKAIATAEAAVENTRDESIAGIQEGINSIEALVGGPDSKRVSIEAMQEILQLTDRIILLAGTFGFQTLSTIAMRLCDLSSRLIELDRGDAKAIRVFVRALRLVAPPSPALSETDGEAMTHQLMRILHHYGVPTGLSQIGNSDGK
jgi:hypothetical protein